MLNMHPVDPEIIPGIEINRLPYPAGDKFRPPVPAEMIRGLTCKGPVIRQFIGKSGSFFFIDLPRREKHDR